MDPGDRRPSRPPAALWRPGHRSPGKELTPLLGEPRHALGATREPVELTTERLLLRRWRRSDREPFAALNSDPRVMEHFPAALTRVASDGWAKRIDAELGRRGYGLWALEVRARGEFVGFTGLQPLRFEAHFTPAVEVGWRLAHSAWGHGYASEAARASLAWGFERAGFGEIVSLTTPANRRSAAVMERIGMVRDPADDFDHPAVEDGHRLRRHILYRISAERWRSLPARLRTG